MILTKYEHAQFTIADEQGNKLIVDPGKFSNLSKNIDNLVAVIITHQHADHVDPELIANIIQHNPNVIIFAPESVGELVNHPITIPKPNTDYTAESFTLRFYGQKHEMIRPKLTIIDNFGVIINHKIAYPGDSFTPSGIKPTVLMLPVAAPWLNVNDAVQLLKQEAPNIAIPTHDAILSDIGKDVYDSHFLDEAQDINTAYQRLAVGESISVD
ncbi:MBL fold metallo-hydrolase [Candidatus Saccharibacteria bacterium]|nr:MBL fold metallo-hydrolase [Candidatus Saccharibacteria bacterium]